MKKRSLLLLLLVLAATPVFCQKINIDSLIRVAISHADRSGVAVIKNRDSLFKAFTLAKSGTERTKNIYKLINYGQPTSKLGLTYHYKILDWARKNNDPISESIITAEIAFEIALNGDVAQAIAMDLKALKQAEATGNNEALGIVYDSMGCCFGIGDTNPSPAKLRTLVSYFKEGVKYSTAAHNDLFISYDLGGAGAIYHLMGKTDSAEYYSFKSFEHAVQKNIGVQVSQSLVDIEHLQTDYKFQLKFGRAAVAVAAKMRDTVQLSFTCIALAKVFQTNNNTDSAMYYAKQAYNFSRYKSVNGQIEPAQILAKLYTKISADSALKYTNIYDADKDSVYSINKAQRAQAVTFDEQQHQQELAETQQKYNTQVKIYLLVAALVVFLAIGLVLWRNSVRNKQANLLLKSQKEQLQQTLHDLKQTQTQLIQSEKMASLGELTAGIAHEIQNPLNFVNNFSDVSVELIDEMQIELTKGDKEEAIAISEDIKQNLEKIRHHGKRADGIVKGMLQHSRASSTTKEPTDINKLADEYLRLAYHGLRAKDKSFNAELITNFADNLPLANVVPQDIGRVLLNLFNNAFYATQQKQKTAGEDYKPTITLTTFAPPLGGWGVKVTDNGNGIPNAIKDKILQPFFTTKPTGEGTGLGLSLSYDIVVKGHGGSIAVDSVENEYSTFIIKLPL